MPNFLFTLANIEPSRSIFISFIIRRNFGTFSFVKSNSTFLKARSLKSANSSGSSLKQISSIIKCLNDFILESVFTKSPTFSLFKYNRFVLMIQIGKSTKCLKTWYFNCEL
uniref:Uncharacterized protein n=1 Tax=Clytia hemisphaerica TaxID=252671 RepID=A0A7M5UP72_9CNID